jgi:hypothetical protein
MDPVSAMQDAPGLQLWVLNDVPVYLPVGTRNEKRKKRMKAKQPTYPGAHSFFFFFFLRARTCQLVFGPGGASAVLVRKVFRTRWYFAHDQYLAALIDRGSSLQPDGPSCGAWLLHACVRAWLLQSCCR